MRNGSLMGRRTAPASVYLSSIIESMPHVNFLIEKCNRLTIWQLWDIVWEGGIGGWRLCTRPPSISKAIPRENRNDFRLRTPEKMNLLPVFVCCVLNILEGRGLRVSPFEGGTESRWHPSYRIAGDDRNPVLGDVLERSGLVVRTCAELVVFVSLFRVFLLVFDFFFSVISLENLESARRMCKFFRCEWVFWWKKWTVPKISCLWSVFS